MRSRPFAIAALSLALLGPARPALADGVLPSAATPVQREQAQSRFLRAKELIGKKRFDEALAELRASREIVASPNARLEIARCLVAMGRVVEAYAELGRTAVEAKELAREDNRYQRTFDAARAERSELEPTLGFVSLTIEHPVEATRVTVAGEEIRRAAWSEPVPVQPGTTEIVLQTPGRLPLRRSLTLTAGEKSALTL
ncbi:MAG: tetratricopeptide repeat protein, partial [Myxococcales bacterium]|nr:tetratricopeptide repeat protein [Myxococcales bacterium]